MFYSPPLQLEEDTRTSWVFKERIEFEAGITVTPNKMTGIGTDNFYFSQLGKLENGFDDSGTGNLKIRI